MFSLSLSGVPQSVLDMTMDLAPLMSGLIVVLGLSLLGIVFAIGVQDTRQAKQRTEPVEGTFPSLPKAA